MELLELSSATTLSSVEDIGFCQWQGEYAFPQHGYHGHHFGDAYIETPAPSSPGGEVYHATERGVRRCYIPAKFSSFPFMNKEYDGLPTPAISPPAFEVYTPPYSQASESPLQSPITTPSSSRRSSLDDSLLLENGYGKAVTTSEPSPVLDEFFSLNTSKSCSAILESSHSPSSSRAGNRRRRHRAASLTIPPLPPAPSPRHTSAFSSPPQPWDIRSLPVEGTVRAPSPDVGRLETAADLLYPPRSPIEPLEYCGSYSPSEESLLLPPSSLFLPEQEQECEAIVQAEDKGVTKALSACLRRKKTLSDRESQLFSFLNDRKLILKVIMSQSSRNRPKGGKILMGIFFQMCPRSSDRLRRLPSGEINAQLSPPPPINTKSTPLGLSRT